MSLMQLLAAGAALLLHLAASAQAYPSGPVKIVIGFGPGGAPDTALRLVASWLEKHWGQPVVVENQVGASGTIAASAVARARPDGQTLLFGVAANLAVAPATMRQPPYDPVKAFTPIAEVARGPYLWLVRSDAPVATMQEFIEWARLNPGRLNYGSPGQGTVHHLATEMLKQAGGFYMVHVPYRGAAYAGLLAGDIHGMFESMPTPMPFLESGRMRALGVTGRHRLAALPAVPTLAEQGLQDMEVNSWWGFVGPAGMPAALVTSLNADIRRVLAEPELRSSLQRAGIEPTGGTAEEFGRYIAQEAQRWKRIVATGALKFD